MPNELMKIACPRAPLSEIELCGWIGRARPGDILEYHRGFLALDTARIDSSDPNKAQRLARLARRARWASDVGLVHLVQRRNGPNDFSYLAIARPRREGGARAKAVETGARGDELLSGTTVREAAA